MRLVQFETEDKLRLNGLLSNVGSRTTILHIHGKCGNFYENKFVKIMFGAYAAANLNFLSFNNRGTACYTEAYKGKDTVYIGTAVEEFTECILDIAAAIKFAESFSERVVLQGHSFGCEKVMYYAQQVNSGIELIVLSPSDGYRLQEAYIFPETVEEQLERLRSTYHLSGMEWLPAWEYGIRARDVEYHVPIVAWSLVGLITGPPFDLLRLGRPWGRPKISNRSFVYIGGEDALQLDGVEAMAEGIKERFLDPTLLVLREGRHDLRPSPAEVVCKIIHWLER